jgi:hypothetical protein
MSGTPTMVTRIVARLSSLTPSPLSGGIYDRPIMRGVYDANNRPDPAGSTPDAFAPTFPYQQRPAAVVTDGTDEVDFFGPDTAWQSFPWIYFYAPPTQQGKDTIANAVDAADVLLHNWRFATANNTGALVKVISRMAVIDDPEDAQRVLGGMRLQVTGLRRAST